MYIRHIAEELKEILSYFPVLGLIGPRQCGKTTLAKVLMHELAKETVYLDLENPKDVQKLADPVFFFEQNTDKCIILDEIQRMPKLFPILRSMIDADRKPARFILLGSASPNLIRDASESLAGRIAYKELSPLGITELKQDIKLFKHWFRGGYPDALLASSQKLWNLWQNNFITSYVERDLPMLGLSINATVARRLLTMVGHINGNLLNNSTIAKSLGMSSPSVQRYLEFMEQAFLIRMLAPYAQNAKKRLVKSPKIYIRDSGNLHYLMGLNEENDLFGYVNVGGSWEGYVIEQISQLLPSQYQLYFYRTHEGTEIDLLITKANKPFVAIEAKMSSAPKVDKGFKIAMDDLKINKGFIITPQTDDYMISKEISVCSLETFFEQHFFELFK